MRARRLIGVAARRLAQQSGFSLVAVLLMLFAVTAVFAASYSVANGDISLTGKDTSRKEAYAAAEAGVNYYQYHLTQDSSYWTYCSGVPAPGPGQPNPVNDVWDGRGNDPRAWRTVPGTKDEYTIEVLPANGSGYAKCDRNNSAASMIDPTTGTFRIRATGRSRGQKRSIVATFRRKSFLDYLYFTDYETVDPVAYQSQGAAQQALLAQQCTQYRRAGRPEPPCSGITFANVDTLLGPFHTNDDIRVCGSPQFGRTSADKIEVSAPAPGWTGNGCAASPNFVGTYKASSPILAMPQSNNALKMVAASQYTFTGTTTIQLNGATMLVTNAAKNLNQSSMPLPPNGVVYVQNGICGLSYNLYQDYNDPAGCADLFVKGSYSSSLTLASENDIIVNGNLTKSGNVTLGLIPNNFVRVYHPVTNRNGNSCTNAAGSPTNVQIDAAILSLAHSFIVDNYFCGAPLGTLTVTGAIAQRFRGPVGTGGANISTGYAKNYTYDDRLKYINPPQFLSPVQAPWDLMRFTEQSPPR
jgi:Tfp pilus assembly protein PilX